MNRRSATESATRVAHGNAQKHGLIWLDCNNGTADRLLEGRTGQIGSDDQKDRILESSAGKIDIGRHRSVQSGVADTRNHSDDAFPVARILGRAVDAELLCRARWRRATTDWRQCR